MMSAGFFLRAPGWAARRRAKLIGGGGSEWAAATGGGLEVDSVDVRGCIKGGGVRGWGGVVVTWLPDATAFPAQRFAAEIVVGLMRPMRASFGSPGGDVERRPGVTMGVGPVADTAVDRLSRRWSRVFGGCLRRMGRTESSAVGKEGATGEIGMGVCSAGIAPTVTRRFFDEGCAAGAGSSWGSVCWGGDTDGSLSSSLTRTRRGDWRVASALWGVRARLARKRRRTHRPRHGPRASLGGGVSLRAGGSVRGGAGSGAARC